MLFRSPLATLGAAALTAAGSVTGDQGAIVLGFPKGFAIENGSMVGVVLDLGPRSLAKRIVVKWSAWSTDGAYRLNVRGSDAPDNNTASGWKAGAFSDAVSGLGATPGPTITAADFASPRRYVQIFFDSTFAQTISGDIWLRLLEVQVFTSTAYESGNASIVTAPIIIRDALDQATVLLSADRSLIDPGAQAAFTFPDVSPDGPRTPREMWALANTPHDWVSMIAVERRAVFRPRPVAPLFEIGAWSGSAFRDASANSGDDIFNRAIVAATDAAGNQMRIDRTQAQQPGTVGEPVTTPAISNPGFDVNTTGWSALSPNLSSTINRSTGLVHSGAGSGRWTLSTGGSEQSILSTAAFTGTFRAGTPYTLEWWQNVPLASVVDAAFLTVYFGVTGAAGAASVTVPFDSATDNGVWQKKALTWTPQADHSSGVNLYFASSIGHPGTDVYLDDLAFTSPKPTVIDRRNFRRTKIVQLGSAVTSTPAQIIGDIYLAGHKTSALKGDIDVTGLGPCRRIMGGAAVHPAMLLRETNQLLTLNNRVDPDTGRLGRDGTIVAVTYDSDAFRASVALDNERDRLEPVLQRYSIISGQA